MSPEGTFFCWSYQVRIVVLWVLRLSTESQRRRTQLLVVSIVLTYHVLKLFK